MEDGLDDQEAETPSGDGGSAPGSVVAILRFQATLRSDTRRRVYLPLPGEPEVRHLAGTVDGRRYRGAVESIEGSPVLVLGPAWRRDCGLKAGDRVRVELEPEGPQRKDLAPDLAAALDASPAAAAFWDELAQFYRRAYLRWIDATKRNPALRAERITAVVALLERGVKERP